MTDFSGWCVHGNISKDHESANGVKLHDPTYPPTHLYNLTIGKGVTRYHKSSHRIELSPLGQDLFHFSDLT